MIDAHSSDLIHWFDVLLFALAILAAHAVSSRWRRLQQVRALFGSSLIVIGIWLLTSVHLVDFVVLMLAPAFGVGSNLPDITSYFHSELEWYVNALASLMIVSGLLMLITRILHHSEREKMNQDRLVQAASLAKLGYYEYNTETEKIEYCSDAHASNHGLPKSEYLKVASTLSNDMPLIHPDDRERVRSLYLDVLAGKTVVLEYRVPTANGEKRVREISRPIFDESGKVVREMGTSLDVTEQFETERKLFQSQKLEAIGQVTGGVAHDFNNLLAVILGNLELLEDERGENEKRELIQNAVEATLHGAELTRNLLSFARQAPLEPTIVDLNQLVRNMKNWIVRTFPATINVETSLLAGLWQTRVDASSAQASLLNLILNARDAMQGDGKLTIETANVRIDDDYVVLRKEDIEPGRYVLLAVSDTGEGIGESVLEKIFEPFFTTKPVGAGSGLGLSMLEGFMKQSGGTVRVYSEQNVGTTFKLYFPALDASQIPAPEKTVPRKADTSENLATILLVEDNVAVLTMIQTALLKAGFRVLVAESGDQGRTMFEEHPDIDLLLTDIVMPGDLQGTTLARELRSLRPELPVIFMSGYASEATVHGNGLRPQDTRLMKPIQRKDLMRAVSKALNRDSQGGTNN